jgi:archaellum component FlaC
MDGGNTVIGLWRNRQTAEDETAFAAEPHVADHARDAVEDWASDDDQETPPRSWTRVLAGALFVLLAAAWVTLFSYLTFFGPSRVVLSPATAADFLVGLSAPLAVLGLGWMLLLRSSKTEARRFAGTAEEVARERIKLEQSLARINDEISASRERLAEQSMQLLSLGDGAAGRVNQMTQAVRAEVESLEKQADLLKASAASARSDVAVLIASLPKAQIQTRQLVVSLQEAATTAQEKAEILDSRLSILVSTGREADEIAGGAAQKLTTQLAEVRSATDAAGTRLEEVTGQLSTTVDRALEQAATALSSAREGMEAQSAAMLAMIEQTQAAATAAGTEVSEQLHGRLAAISSTSESITEALGAQNQQAAALKQRLEADIDFIAARLADLESTGVDRSERLAATLGALRDNADSLGQVLAQGGENAKVFIDRSEGLLTALDAVTREIDETLPAAYDRLAGQASDTLRVVEKTVPQASEAARLVDQTARSIAESEAALAKQDQTVAAFNARTETGLRSNLSAVNELNALVRETETQVDGLSANAGPRLVEALLRVRETATQAADHARTTLGDVIPQSAAELGEHSKAALSEALTAQVESQMAEIARITEQAVSSAQAATDRLMRQMLTISETSAALEKRIAEAKQEVEASDQASFARRVALLIESLNSTAIDVTKILSNDVTDSTWAAYLKGDRGVFARRAVRLLDATEVKEILRHYQDEPEFREHVNRYIHDFEAMLRNVLSTRDGSPLGVTLLSSDNGKLYVALAQAIERLRR